MHWFMLFVFTVGIILACFCIGKICTVLYKRAHHPGH